MFRCRQAAAALALVAQAPGAAQSRLLDQVPAEAHTVLHLQDATVVLEQIQRNDVYRLLGTEAGEPLYHQLRSMSVEDFDDMINLGQVLAGEAVFFKAKQALQKRDSSLKHLKQETEVLLSGIMAPHPIS